MKPVATEMSKVFVTFADGTRGALFVPAAYEARFVESCRNNATVTLEEHRKLTVEAAARATAAMMLAKDVPQEVQDERLATCEACEFYRKDKDTGDFFCKRCGCNLKGKSVLGHIYNMIQKVEKLTGGWPTWGCKHPRRGKIEGKGWKR